MSWQSNLEELIKLLVKKSIPIIIVEGTVTEVYEDSCDVEIEKDLTLFKVRLNTVLKQENGLQIKPKKGCKAICGIVENNPNDAFIIKVTELEAVKLSNVENIEISQITSVKISDADEVIINDGGNGGLTITPKLVEELNKNNKVLQSIMQILTGSPITEPGNGAPSALQTALKGAISGKQLGDFSKIENEKIKH